MQEMLKNLPNIYIVFIFALALLGAWTYTRDNNIFQLLVTVGGALVGLAMRPPSKEQTTNIENVEKASVNVGEKDKK